MISKEEVKHIAKLARLGLSGQEIEKMRKELSNILGYFEKLQEVDVSGVKPMSHSILLENAMREDKQATSDKRQAIGLMELAPETKNSYLKVKSILR